MVTETGPSKASAAFNKLTLSGGTFVKIFNKLSTYAWGQSERHEKKTHEKKIYSLS